MDLQKLNRPLDIQHIDFRVAQLIEGKDAQKTVYANILAYKDARVDMKMLDEAVGAMNWQTAYERDSKGVLKAGIGVWDETKNLWVWKWSNGTESNTEAEKGEYSDAFKRAGFMWGIGRHLYDMPTIFVRLEQGEYYSTDGRVKASAKLRPKEWNWSIEYKDGHVIKLQATQYDKVSKSDKVRFNYYKNV
jgi:hypothetical protein